MENTSKVVKNADEMQSAAAAKRKQAKAATEYRKRVAAEPDQVFDGNGDPLTNHLYFEGYERAPKGMITSGAKKTIQLKPLSKYAALASVSTLRDQATNWDVTYYKTANEHLYKLLADVYVVAKGLRATESDEKVLRNDLKEYAKQIGVVVKSSTSPVGILVSCVFQNIPRQRRSAYSIGLQNLIEANGWECDAETVAQLIDTAGGIYELAQPYKDTAKSAQPPVKTEVLLNRLKSTTICKANDIEFASVLAKADTQYAVVVTRKSDGTVNINGVTEDAAIVLSIARKINAQVATDYVELEVDNQTDIECFNEVGYSSTTLEDYALAA
jgi:hypothetical protein